MAVGVAGQPLALALPAVDAARRITITTSALNYLRVRVTVLVVRALISHFYQSTYVQLISEVSKILKLIACHVFWVTNEGFVRGVLHAY